MRTIPPASCHVNPYEVVYYKPFVFFDGWQDPTTTVNHTLGEENAEAASVIISSTYAAPPLFVLMGSEDTEVVTTD